MKCYRCGSANLKVAEVTRYERNEYARIGIRMLRCCNCGLEQNHQGDDDPEPVESAIKEQADGNGN